MPPMDCAEFYQLFSIQYVLLSFLHGHLILSNQKHFKQIKLWGILIDL